ncbi:hypothetical protein MRX96_001488 [Rhipicephalus microplus]
MTTLSLALQCKRTLSYLRLRAYYKVSDLRLLRPAVMVESAAADAAGSSDSNVKHGALDDYELLSDDPAMTDAEERVNCSCDDR